MAKPNLFTKAAAVPAAPKKEKKSDKVELKTARLAQYAAVNALMKSLETIQATLKGDIEGQMVTYFKGVVVDTKKKPDSYRGIDGEASASLEFRKRSVRSILTDAECETLTNAKIPYGEDVKVTECFVINPKYSEDSALLEKVSGALSKIKDLPEDLIQHQAKVATRTVTDETIDGLCKDPILFAQLFNVVSVLAIKAKTNVKDAEKLFDEVKDLITEAKEEASEEV